MGGITVTQRFKIAKIILFQYPRWLPWWPSWNSSNDISSQVVRLRQNLMGGITVTQRFRIAKIVPFWYHFFKRHLLPNCKLDGAKTWWETSQWHRNSELLKLFCWDIKDGGHGGYLETLQTTSLPNCKSDWAKTWWETSQWHKDSELLK